MYRVDLDREGKFREIYSDHSAEILKYALRRSSAKEVAADIVADTFVVAWQKIDDVPDGEQALYWLYGTARRVLANHNKKMVNREYLNGDLKQYLQEHGSVDFPDSWADKIVVQDALDELSFEEFELVTLCYWDGFKPHEVGKILAVPAVLVRKRLFRIRSKLKKKLI